MPVNKITSGKVRYHGVVNIPACIEPVAEVRKVIHEDLKKYKGYNMVFSDTDPWEFVDAIQRHLNKIYEEADPFALDHETGCPHISHIACNQMFLEIKRRKGIK